MVLCMCCKYGTSVHVVWCACRTCCVEGMRYYVCALCSHGIMTCVFVMLYSVYVYVFCYTLSVGICVMMYIQCGNMYCVVLYIGCRCMCCVLGVDGSIA